MAVQWDLINSLFLRAIALGADERMAFVREACAGDVELQSQVESLLASHVRASQFLERPVFDVIQATGGDGRTTSSGQSLAPEDRRLMTLWVRGALELPVVARPAWLQAATRNRQELLPHT